MEIKRDFYLNKLIRSMHNGMVKIITGIRRCGKSYLLNTIFKDYLLSTGILEERIIQIDLSSSEHANLANPIKLDEYIKGKINKKDEFYLFIDEIQFCESVPNPAFEGSKTTSERIPQINFYNVLNGLLSSYPNVDIYVTGSNSHLLSSDILTEFRGRGWQIDLAPLSFSEYVGAFPKRDKRILFEEYLTFGGMPGMAAFGNNQDKISYLNSLFELTYLKDILEHAKISNDASVKELLSVLASSEGSLISINKISEIFKQKIDKSISRLTIEKYISAFMDSFLISEAPRFDIRGNKMIASNKKYYFADCGLRNALLSFSQNDRGHLMESAIYRELRRRGYAVNVGIVPVTETSENGSRTRKQYEVDFVASLGNSRIYIQSAYKVYDEEKLQQESSSFLRIRDSFKKIIVEGDLYLPYTDKNGIEHTGIIEFLCDDKYCS